MKAFRNITLTAAIALISFNTASAQWNTLEHDATTNRSINDITFVGSTGYALGQRSDAITFGSRGMFYKTTDGGLTWNMSTLPLLIGSDSVFALTSGQFLDPNKGYATAICYTTNGVGGFYYGTLLQTTDGGTTWTVNYSTKSQLNYTNGNNIWFNHIFFDDNYHAILSARQRTSSSNYNGIAYYTYNGGNNWYPTTAFTGSQANASFFFTNGTGCVAGGKMQSLMGPYDGKIARSTDAGATYTTTYSDPNFAYVDIMFPSTQVGYAIGDSMYNTMPGGSLGKIIKTTNGGQNWALTHVFSNFMPLTVYFVDDNTGYVGGETAAGTSGIMKTTDGGLSWTPENYPDVAQNSYITSITGTTPFTLYASNAWSSSTSVYGNFSASSCMVFAGPDTTFCQQQGQLFATPATPSPDYVFSWSPSTGLSDSTAQNPYVNHVSNQQYVVTMTNTVTMCSATDTIVVSVYNPVFGPQYICSSIGDSTLLDLGPGGASYMWQFFTDTSGNTSNLGNLNQQTYWATQPGHYLAIANFTGCGALTSYIQVIDSCFNQAFTCGVNAGPDTTFCQLQGQLMATPASPGNYTYSWSPATGLYNPNIQNPSVIAGVNNQQYVVTMTDAAQGCTATDTVIVSAYYFHIDTAYSCGNQPVTFDLGPGGTNYTVQFTDTAGNFHFYQLPNEYLVATQPAQYLCIAFFPGCGALTSMITVIDSCNVPVGNVWPGDCNYDLSANMADALWIGMGYNTSGATRPSATPLWYAQPMTDWSQNFVNCNYKHADADGNGLIDVNDTLPIAMNYGLTHPYRLSQPVYNSSLPDLYLVANYDTVGLQTLVTVDVRLGTLAMPIDSLYGISFRITADAPLIDTNMTVIDPATTWLGTASNSFNFRKYFRSNGTVDVAECKKNHQNTFGGNGTIATFRIVTTDNVSGIQVCHFNLSDITAVTVGQQYLNLNMIGDSVVIDPTHPAGVEENGVRSVEFGVYPNPAAYEIGISTTTIADEIIITDMLGQVVKTVKPVSNNSSISIADLANGIYLVSVKSGNSIATKRITIAH